MSDADLIAQITTAHGLAQLGGGSGGETFYCQCGVVTRGTDDEGFLAPHLLHVATITVEAVREQVAAELSTPDGELV